MKKALLVFACFAVTTLCFFPQYHSAKADTVKLPKAGGGSTEIKTDRNGKEVQTTNRLEDGTVTDTTQTDPKTGKVTKTKYDKGKPEVRTTTNKDGVTTKIEYLDESGTNPIDVETFTEDGEFASHTRYTRDENGNITVIDNFGEDGFLKETRSWSYHKNGKISSSDWKKVGPNGKTLEVGHAFYDEEGNLISSGGNIDGINDWLPGAETGDPNTHVTTDEFGYTTKVRHNPDGTVDVTVTDKFGMIISLQYLSGGCFYGDECPFEHLKKKKKPATNTGPLEVTIPHGPVVETYIAMAVDAHDRYGDLDSANDWLVRALELDPSNYVAQRLLVRVEAAQQQVALRRAGIALGALQQMLVRQELSGQGHGEEHQSGESSTHSTEHSPEGRD